MKEEVPSFLSEKHVILRYILLSSFIDRRFRNWQLVTDTKATAILHVSSI